MLGLIAFGQLKAFSHSVCFYFWRKTVPETVKPGTVPPKRPCPYLKRNRSSETFWRSRTHRVGHGRLIRRFHSSGTCVATPARCFGTVLGFGIEHAFVLIGCWLLVTGRGRSLLLLLLLLVLWWWCVVLFCRVELRARRGRMKDHKSGPCQEPGRLVLFRMFL